MATNSLKVRPATTSDLDQLSTIFTRSFHPVSPYMRRTFPDTAAMRAWWRSLYTTALADPEATLMVVTTEPSGNDDSVIALGQWRFFPDYPHRPPRLELESATSAQLDPNGNLAAGTWSLLRSCEDTDLELYRGMTGFLAEMHGKMMAGTPHYNMELLATVQEAKGKGAGRLLVEELGRVADAKGVVAFVETNNIVVEFYRKMGWVVKEQLAMPGGVGYEEYILVREPKKE
ncbi:uncharacterized protein HMPREF1541_08113 [Cyphellophora europaea CBS 101466]|uniref:N-acetyltransferase domain-containing protein n=1 Tax=Cyphellophora europaea (strain CBS 101466) TaxID=1220924 RepID=W2RN36_CYPE1|nr:uncharacterized protein HMPREF1541_08113 [Cyphellophora europaea CBS 101466]ETN37123.1 hypothetical protein HMPREF1541_08113 [Cyphellophora europaea CBS 101466]